MTKNISTPKVTIVTVVFNIIKNGRKDNLFQCIDSVSRQDYPNIQHLIIDGASKDGTLDFLKQFKNCDIVSEPDSGIFDAMNKGIRKAEGKYVAFLNSDDFYSDPEAVSKVVRALEKKQGDFSYAPCYLLDENGNRIFSPADINAVFNRAPFYHITMFTRRDVLLKENCFRLDLRLSADSDLITRLALKKYKGVYLENPFATFRLGGASVDAQKCKEECQLFAFENFSKFCGLSREDAERMVWSEYIPKRFLLQLFLTGNFSIASTLFKRKLKGKLKAHWERLKKILLSPWKSLKALIKKIIKKVGKKIIAIVKEEPLVVPVPPQATVQVQEPQEQPQQPQEQPQEQPLEALPEMLYYTDIERLPTVKIGEGTVLLPHVNINTKFRNPVTVGKDCILANMFIFESDSGCIEIGNRVFINAQTRLISRSKITIEDNVTIAWGCTIYDHNSHSLDYMERRKDLDRELEGHRKYGDMLVGKDWSVVKSKPIRICKDAWLGFDVTVLAGVTIGEGAIIGARSVVRSDIPPFTVAAGNPAVVIKQLRKSDDA